MFSELVTRSASLDHSHSSLDYDGHLNYQFLLYSFHGTLVWFFSSHDKIFGNVLDCKNIFNDDLLDSFLKLAKGFRNLEPFFVKSSPNNLLESDFVYKVSYKSKLFRSWFHSCSLFLNPEVKLGASQWPNPNIWMRSWGKDKYFF